MKIAAVLGLDTAAGAYLARLLVARGVAVRGTGGAALLERLDVAREVTRTDAAATASFGADLVFDLRGDAGATRALLAAPPAARVFVAVDPGDGALIADLAAARAAGRFVATSRVFAHESRLGPGTSPIARIIAAVAAGRDPEPIDLASRTDCGWTPEYVDAMARTLQQPRARDVVIASGTELTGLAAAHAAARWFKRPLVLPVLPDPAPTASPQRPDPALGWHAVTVGTDLVDVLCEGVAGG